MKPLLLGRRYTESDIENGEKPFIPLETFTVQQMGTYRFRIMNVGFAQPFEISFEAVRNLKPIIALFLQSFNVNK